MSPSLKSVVTWVRACLPVLICALLTVIALACRATPTPSAPTPVLTLTYVSPPPPTETPQPAQLWTTYTNGNEVVSLAWEGDHLWAATHGGAVRWDVAG